MVCNVYFPTETKKGYVLDVKISESIKYKKRHESTDPNEVTKWLQTFDEIIGEGKLDDLKEQNPNVFYQLADCDTDDIKSVDSNIVLESIRVERRQ